MKQQILNQLRRLNIYSLQPYIDEAKNKSSIILKFESPYFVVRYNGYYYDDTSINNNLRKKPIIAYLRLRGIHHYIYYLKDFDKQQKLYNMVNNSNGQYQLMQVLTIHNYDNLYTIHKTLPENPTPKPSLNDDQTQLPTITNDTNATPYLFRHKSSKEKPTLYFYKALLPQIQDYKQFQNLCYLLHILKNTGTIAVNGLRELFLSRSQCRCDRKPNHRAAGTKHQWYSRHSLADQCEPARLQPHYRRV